LGLLYAELKQQQQMMAALKKAADYMPQNARVHYNYGLACQNAEQPEAAAAQFQMALQLEPQNLDFLYAAAINFLQQGNRRAATEFVQQMLIINQRDERAISLMKNLQRSGPNARGK
jgi:tetratricopeptide (TPR) repeat protein